MITCLSTLRSAMRLPSNAFAFQCICLPMQLPSNAFAFQCVCLPMRLPSNVCAFQCICLLMHLPSNAFAFQCSLLHRPSTPTKVTSGQNVHTLALRCVPTLRALCDTCVLTFTQMEPVIDLEHRLLTYRCYQQVARTIDSDVNLRVAWIIDLQVLPTGGKDC